MQRTGSLHKFASFVQQAEKKQRKGPYPPNSDNYVATVLSVEALRIYQPLNIHVNSTCALFDGHTQTD